MSQAIVHVIEEKDSATGQCIVADPVTKKCAIIDPVLDYEPASGKIKTLTADKLLEVVAENGYQLEWVLDTHVHADHISASHYLKTKTGAKNAIGVQVKTVQEAAIGIYDLPHSHIEGDFWDVLWNDNDEFQIGELKVKVLHSPGHTPADVAYYIENDAVFTGDSIFMPDNGTARCDFPGGSVPQIWESIQRILNLPPGVRVFVGHDYPPQGRSYSISTTVEAQRNENKHVKIGTSQEEFSQMRTTRDAQLGTPRLLHASIQFNIRGGSAPPSGWVKIPVVLPQ
jgi:glyoxylase-like metal-dependent hydrolase (beta-lactamase superfamily II)